jgi:hypothetical protein
MRASAHARRVKIRNKTLLVRHEIPLDDVRAEFSMKFGDKIDVLETMETGAAA